jgi:hypothetical protein
MHRIAFAAILSIFIASPVLAEGEIVITQAKALAGNVTPGDTAGFPVTLSRPGAYVMTSNLTVPAGGSGLYITSNNVDIDMNGFLLTGNGTANYGLVSHLYGQSRIHGGVISRFRNSGIYLRKDAWTIENMKIVQNGGMGIDATDALLITVQNSLVAVNGNYGIQTGSIGLFRNNQVVNNAWSGIFCRESCLAEGNMIDLNNIYGIVFNSGMASGNTITRNRLAGLYDNTGSNDTGYSNNMFVNNNTAGPQQVYGGVAVHPNTCTGKPCNAP